MPPGPSQSMALDTLEMHSAPGPRVGGCWKMGASPWPPGSALSQSEESLVGTEAV